MKLRQITVRRLPGIPDPFTLEDLADGLVVIEGPNGIGKSSLARAIAELFWGGPSPGSETSLEARLERDGKTWRVEHDGARHRWECDGEEETPDDLPPKHLQQCFSLGLRDLLDASDGAGKDLADEVRKQLAGGYELAKLAEEIEQDVRAAAGKKERDAVNAAAEQVRKSMAQQAALAGRQDEIPALEARAQEARRASERLPHLADALALIERREELAPIAAELEGFPPAIERVHGDEVDRLDGLETEQARKQQALRDERTELARARDAAAATGLPTPIDDAVLTQCKLRATDLRELDRKRGEAKTALAEAERELAAASQAIGGHATPAADLDLPAAQTLFDFLRKIEDARKKQEALEQRIALLARQTPDANRKARIDQLRNATRALADWLRAPDPEAGSERATLWPPKRAVALLAGALAIAGAALGHWVDASLYGLVGVALGLAAAAALVRIRRSGHTDQARPIAQSAFPNAIAGPESWSTAAVGERLTQLQDELAREQAIEQRAHYQEADRADLDVKLAAARGEMAGLERTRADLAQQLGLDAVPANTDLVDLARSVDALRAATRKREAAAGRLAELDRQLADGLADLPPELSSATDGPPPDAAAARAAADSLEHRDRELRQANGRIADHLRRVGTLETECATLDENHRRLFADLSLTPGDRYALETLVSRLETYQDRCKKRDSLETQIAVLEQRLQRAGEQELMHASRRALEDLREGLEHTANELPTLVDALADTRADIRKAQGAHTLEEALAARDEARLELAECRKKRLRARAASLLLEEVRAEHATAQAPRVLKRARALFETFTHHDYDLRVPSDGDSSFIAVESATGRGRKTTELSDGTRAQLILAARVAFAEDSEGGARMPLVLDEALDHADPVRFDAIARSLARMTADDGRQILYLTNDPTESTRLRNAFEAEGCKVPQEIDLAAVRGVTTEVQGPDRVAVPPLPEVPSAEGWTPEEYAVQIHAARLDPRREADGQDLFHLLHDDLALVELLRRQRIATVGQWRTLAKSDAPLAVEVRERAGAGSSLDARADLLDKFLTARQQGRGKPVDRMFIERADSISEHFREAVIAINDEVGCDADELARTLTQKKKPPLLKGFKSAKAAKFVTSLQEEGYLDPRPVLDEGELRAQLLASPAARNVSSETVGKLAHRWWALAERATD